ncbi:MAG: putative sugar O-methyltransferase [Candidatus Paceibacterota bacterium]|jgi:putative sugar O-methyltransferase
MKLSVIIPCYNCAQTLEQAVASVYAQNLTFPFEIILVDDNSTDGSSDIITKLGKEHPNLKTIFHKENMGGGAARNTAVENSTGEIIFCLDSDDLVPQGTLEKMVNFLEAKKCDGVSVHRSIKFSGTDTKNTHHVDTSPYPGQEVSLVTLLTPGQGFFPLYVNFMYTRKAFNKAGGYPTAHGYDTQGFAWNFLGAGLRAYTCPEAEYLHRINFNESYYLREYNNGKTNYNWREILIKHHYVFTKAALDFIINFDCRDFTRNIMAELINMNGALKPDFVETLGKEHLPPPIVFPPATCIKRNSFWGYYLRTKHKLKNVSKKIMQKIKSFVAKVYRYIYSAALSPFTKKVSKEDFWAIYLETKKIYLDTKSSYNFSDFIIPDWRQNMLTVEDYFLNKFSFSFLNNRVIKNTMFMYTFRRWRDIQKSLIAKYFNKDQAREILHEHNLGRPLLNDAEYVSSGNNIHHLYHLIKFFEETKTKASDFKTVVEVGGGYGNMARLFKKLNSELTYTIIDIPIFSFIQIVYLKTILGRAAVNLVSKENSIIKTGKINIIPLDKDLIKSISPQINCDIFISTWALSESNKNMQDLIKEFDYFKAKYLLLAYQKSNASFSYAEEIKNTSSNYQNVYNEETAYTKDNYYLFCQRLK